MSESLANLLNQMNPTDSFLLRAKLGLIEDVDLIFLEFENEDVDAGATETVWPLGGLYALPSAAAATTIVSASANDTSAGTGARTVKVTGLDASRNVITETATMNGITPVALTAQFLRINKIEVMTAGSGLVNDGLITVQINSANAGGIAAGTGISNDGFYSMPNSSVYKKGLLLFQSVSASRSGTGYVDIDLTRYRDGLKRRVFDIGLNFAGSSSFQESNPAKSLIMEPGDDLVIEADTDSNNVKVEGTAVLLLFKA